MNEIKRTSIEVFNVVVNIVQGHQMNSPVAILILISKVKLFKDQHK